MGYDMRIRGNVPAAPEHDIQQAKDAYEAARAAVTARHQAGEFKDNTKAFFEAELVPEQLWSAYYRLKDPSYFRLNNGGMGRYADAMHELGMAHESTSGLDWSKAPEYPEDDENDENLDAYRAAMDKFTGAHGTPADKPTIPLHKFSSNDGWFVTPEEIRAALDAYDTRCSEELSDTTRDLFETDYWGEFIAWLRLAAEHDGFRVH